MENWGIGSVIFSILVVLQPQKALKIWRPSTDLGDPANWVGHDLPTICDRLLLKDIQDNTQMPTNFELKVQSLILPRQGILKFPEKSILKLAGRGECSGKEGKDVEFLRNAAKGWLDPDNWNSTERDVTGSWLPHSERIPCAGEAVLFPKNLSYSVVLPSVLVPSGPITIKDKSMNVEEWSQFLQSEEGFETFQGDPDLRMTRWRSDKGCFNPKFCTCGRDAYAIRDWSITAVATSVLHEAICMYARRNCETTEKPQCYSPVYPEGHCCGVCGIILNVQDKTKGGALSSLTKTVQTVITDMGQERTPYYVGRRADGNIQIVLLSKDGDPAESFTIAQSISKQIKKDYSELAVRLTVSGVSRSNKNNETTVSIVFGTLIAIISLFASIYFIYIVLPKQKWGQLADRDPFTFARFRNTLYGATSTETLSLEREIRPVSDSFANPLYLPDDTPARPLITDLPKYETKEEEMVPLQPTASSKVEQLIYLDDIQSEEKAPTEEVHPDSDSEESENESDQEGSITSFANLRNQEASHEDPNEP